jgi:hypothetical protein
MAAHPRQSAQQTADAAYGNGFARGVAVHDPACRNG